MVNLDDDATASDYDAGYARDVMSELAQLLQGLSPAVVEHHIRIVGGLWPTLMYGDHPGPFMDPTTGAELRHVGTSDADILLSLALFEGDTADYGQRLSERLARLGYRSDPQERGDWRWIADRPFGRMVIDLLCPTSDAHPDGGNPNGPDDVVAHRNLGPIDAARMPAGRLVDLDRGHSPRERVRIADLDLGAGTGPYTFLCASLPSWLAMKVAALAQRTKPKDAYDLAFVAHVINTDADHHLDDLRAFPSVHEPLFDELVLRDLPDYFRDGGKGAVLAEEFFGGDRLAGRLARRAIGRAVDALRLALDRV